MRPAILPCLALVVGTTTALADCPDPDGTILSCTLRDGTRAVDVCITGEDVTYAFGKPGLAPELTLSAPILEVHHQPWHGVGRSIWESTTFHNAGHAYEVYISVDRLTDDHPTSSGITVTKGGEEIAQLDCDPGSDTIGLWALSDAKAARGQCWQPDSLDWGACQ